MSIYLSKLGYDLILVARRKQKLEELKKANGEQDAEKIDDLMDQYDAFAGYEGSKKNERNGCRDNNTLYRDQRG